MPALIADSEMVRLHSYLARRRAGKPVKPPLQDFARIQHCRSVEVEKIKSQFGRVNALEIDHGDKEGKESYKKLIRVVGSQMIIQCEKILNKLFTTLTMAGQKMHVKTLVTINPENLSAYWNYCFFFLEYERRQMTCHGGHEMKIFVTSFPGFCVIHCINIVASIVVYDDGRVVYQECRAGVLKKLVESEKKTMFVPEWNDVVHISVDLAMYWYKKTGFVPTSISRKAHAEEIDEMKNKVLSGTILAEPRIIYFNHPRTFKLVSTFWPDFNRPLVVKLEDWDKEIIFLPGYQAVTPSYPKDFLALPLHSSEKKTFLNRRKKIAKKKALLAKRTKEKAEMESKMAEKAFLEKWG